MNDPLTPEMQYERDVRLYGVTVARWLKAQKNLIPVQDADPLTTNGTVHSIVEGRTVGANPATGDKPFNLKSLESYL